MTKTKKDYFKTFCLISKTFGESKDLNELLTIIVSKAVETMEAKAACLFLEEKGQDVFIQKAQVGLSENYLHADPVKAKQIEDTLLKKGYLSVFDATKDKKVQNHKAKAKEGIASILVVPVLVEQKLIGVLSLYTAKPRKFSSEEIEFLTALAEQGGRAIEKSRLIEQVRTNTKIFHQMASGINASLDIKEILHNLTVTLCEALNMKGVSIRLLNQETGETPIVASHGLSDDFLYKSKGSIQKSVQDTLNGETVVIENMKEDERVQHLTDAQKEGINSALFVPIKTQGETVGIMRLFSDIKQEFSEDTIALVNALAEQGGLAIQNASMLLMLQEDKKQLEEDMWTHKSWF